MRIMSIRMLSCPLLCLYFVLVMYFSVSALQSLPKRLGLSRIGHFTQSQRLGSISIDQLRGLSSVATSPSLGNNQKGRGVAKTTGVLAHSWPSVQPAATHFKRALVATKTIKPDPSIKNARQAQRKYTAMYIDGLMKALNAPLTSLLTLYEKGGIKRLHPYEAIVANLTITSREKAGHPSLPQLLSQLRALRSKTSTLSKMYAHQAAQASSAKECKDILATAVDALKELYGIKGNIGANRARAPDISVKPLQTLSEADEDAPVVVPAVVSEGEYQALEEMAALHKALRTVPVVDLSLPTVVLVGMPNVGKSSLVRALSSALPEVNHYPFTTRGVSIGHIYEDEEDGAGAWERVRVVEGRQGVESKQHAYSGDLTASDDEYEADGDYADEEEYADEIDGNTRLPASSDTTDTSDLRYHYKPPQSKHQHPPLYQVMDTPGLLDRPPAERNSMEQLTFASLSALPTAVIYVIDLSGKGVRGGDGKEDGVDGTGDSYEASIRRQLKVRALVRAQFPRRPWIDVLSKADDVLDVEDASSSIAALLPPEALRVSVRTGMGLDSLRMGVRQMLQGLEARLREGRLRE